MKKVYLLHPFLFALFPPVLLYVQNSRSVFFSNTIRSLLICLLAAAFLVLFFRIIFKTYTKAALFTTLTIFFFFSYYHFMQFIPQFTIVVSSNIFIGKHKIFFPLFGILYCFLFWKLRKTKRPLVKLSKYITVVFTILLLINFFKLAEYHVSKVRLAEREFTEAASVRVIHPSQLPDVYYIILDAYAREDALKETFGFDNRPFLDFLEENGFYVATQSASNYAQTYISIASSLNMNYLDQLIKPIPQNSDDRNLMSRFIQENQVAQLFKKYEYAVAVFDSGFTATGESPLADVHYSQFLGMNQFEQRLLNTTLVRRFGVFLKLDLSIIARERFLYNFKAIQTLPANTGPTFTFLHVLSPHPPFIFGLNGEVKNKGKPYSIADGSGFQGTPEEYRDGYTQQLTFLNKTLQKMISVLLTRSENPPIIILQSDHGSRSGSDHPDKVNIHERMSNFTAIFAPEPVVKKLYPTITPVNIFRILFSELFNEPYPPLPDKSFYSAPDSLYKLYEVQGDKISPNN